jgi:hypothetical protein
MSLPTLFHYDAACQALAEAVRTDEAKGILDVAVAMQVYARQAKNREAEENATELRMRATRRIGELIEAQKGTVGLSQGGRPTKTGVSDTPVLPTLAMQGIDKNLAKHARTLGALSDQDFEAVVTDARDKVARAVRNAVREVEISQERESYTGRTEQGGTVADLEALAASGFKAGVIVPDFPWSYETYSGKGKQRSADRHYDTWPARAHPGDGAAHPETGRRRLCAAAVGRLPLDAGSARSHQSLRLRVQDLRV